MVCANHDILRVEFVAESMNSSEFYFDTVFNHHLMSNVKFGTNAVDHSELQSHPVSSVHS